MERDEALALKTVELAEQLAPWAKANLVAGEQLVFSLRVKKVPLVVRDTEDETTQKENLLNMKVLDFFTLERVSGFQNSSGGVGQLLVNCLYKDEDLYISMTLGRFLEEVTEAQLLRIPNLGKKSLRLLKEILQSESLTLKG